MIAKITVFVTCVEAIIYLLMTVPLNVLNSTKSFD